MRGVVFSVVFLILVSVVSAQELNDYESLKLNVGVTGNVEVLKDGSYQLEYLSSELSFFPRTWDFQVVGNEETFSSPDSKITKGDNIVYRWEEFNPSLEFGVGSEVESDIYFNKINKKVKYPIEDVDLTDFKEYLESSDLVNSDSPKIKAQAEKLAEGEDDLYVVTYNVAQWTKDNINYSLESLTAEASQNSLWVLQNKRGVCDELTTLFVAMMRSLGVPARFALGSSYTNVIGGFGNHAWAEVYFPDVGWVAFDPTYGQFGYVDATHVKMKETLDVKDPSISYRWKARNVEVEPGEVNIDVSVAEKGELLDYDVDMEIELLRNKVGAGSYVPLRVDVKNNENYYLPVNLFLIKGPTQVDDNSIDLLLKPNSETTTFFHIETPKDLDKNLVYESEIEILGPGKVSRSVKLEYGKHYTIYTREEANSRMEQVEKENEDDYEIDLYCNPEKDVYYITDMKGRILCELSNGEDLDFKELTLCFEGDCKDLELLKNGEEKVEFEFDLKERSKEAFVSLDNHEVARSSYFDINIIEGADVAIINIEHPKNVDYKGKGDLEFTLNPNSKVNSVSIKVGGKEVFSKEEIRFRNDFVVPFNGDFFYFRDPYIVADYIDLNGKQHTTREVVDIEIINVPWYGKIMKLFSF